MRDVGESTAVRRLNAPPTTLRGDPGADDPEWRTPWKSGQRMPDCPLPLRQGGLAPGSWTRQALRHEADTRHPHAQQAP
jgi:hypothetical protein